MIGYDNKVKVLFAGSMHHILDAATAVGKNGVQVIDAFFVEGGQGIGIHFLSVPDGGKKCDDKVQDYYNKKYSEKSLENFHWIDGKLYHQSVISTIIC
jgi:hypothetical protein